MRRVTAASAARCAADGGPAAIDGEDIVHWAARVVAPGARPLTDSRASFAGLAGEDAPDGKGAGPASSPTTPWSVTLHYPRFPAIPRRLVYKGGFIEGPAHR